MILDLFATKTESTPVLQTKTDRLFQAVQSVLNLLSSKTSVSAKALQEIMTRTYGGSDASGAWLWKDAYEVLEIAQVRFIQKYTDSLQRMKPEMVVTLLENLAALCPTHTKRSEESVAMQQFSTPLSIGFIAAHAAKLNFADTVLEPSAGTGMLAAMASIAGVKLILNELANDRRDMLERLYPKSPLSAHNAEYLNDYLDSSLKPTVVIMNPPFSSSPNCSNTRSGVTMQHIMAALKLLPVGGRLVTITGEGFSPFSAKYRPSFVNLQKEARVVYSSGIAGKLYAKQGTTVDTRITVIDRIPAVNPEDFSCYYEMSDNIPALLALVARHVPARSHAPEETKPTIIAQRPLTPSSNTKSKEEVAIELEYLTREWLGTDMAMSDGIYEAYEPQTVVVDGAKPHPSALVQSAAMASIAPPKPTYRPHIYPNMLSNGLLSNAQMESLIYAGQAHSEYLDGYYTFDDELRELNRATLETEGAFQLRRGWYLGDGTGCGKGRQVAGILMDNWLKGRKRGVWLSKNDKLLEDSRRDWVSLGGKDSDIKPQWDYKQGTDISLSQGILFTTYATLRSSGRQGKKSRLEQITDWLGKDFDGCIMFDEAHSMANAIASKSNRGSKKASAQGVAGLELQMLLPNARVVYVSATGATTVSNLAYAERLGIWGSTAMPFGNRNEFIGAMEKGGIAAMEVISRDLKALGLYTARSLSYDGVTYEFLQHSLTDEQIRIYDMYAEAFKVIHHNIEAALLDTNVNKADGNARNGMAKAATRSAFEGNKQRFFNHLITAMKCPSLIKAIEKDMEEGHAAVVQVISTSEALLERRLAEIPASEWNNLNVDVTPKEYVMDYLNNGFPVELHMVYTDAEGKETTRPARDEDGKVILSRAALEKRDALLEKLAGLPAVPSALDQIIHHFGHEKVAEVTGRSRRIVKINSSSGDRLCVQNRPTSSNITETHAFQDDIKQILVFSEAGGTGRSYHADLKAKNQRLRRHYLLEPGWKADAAIQGLGRTNRTNLAQAPVFVPVASDVQGEKRFLSTIARRLDTLGAITKGQRETGSQGMFREEDNLESAYAKAALRELLTAIYQEKIHCCSRFDFMDATGLELEKEGGLREDLPEIHTFLNRVLALPIHLQNALFEEFTLRLVSRIEDAKTSGHYEVGVETLKAESFTVVDSQILYTHPGSGSETLCSKIERKDRTLVRSLESALAYTSTQIKGKLAFNEASGRVAVVIPTNTTISERGEPEERVLIRPTSESKMARAAFSDSGWKPIDVEQFSKLWSEEISNVPEFTASSFYLITGLLLPIWKKLPSENVKVFRLKTVDGQNMLGRMVEVSKIGEVYKNFDLADDAPKLSSNEILDSVMRLRQNFRLPNGLEIRCSTIMGNARIELTGFTEGQKDMLKSLGCMVEIIQYKLRLFVPANDNAPTIIDRLLKVA